MSWICFWKESGSLANEFIRLGKLQENPSIRDIHYPIYKYYIKNIKDMENEMKKNRIREPTVLYRSVRNDIFRNLTIGEEFSILCYTSCYTDNWNEENGSILIKVVVPNGARYLSYENVVILPSGIFIYDNFEDGVYTIKIKQQKNFFN